MVCYWRAVEKGQLWSTAVDPPRREEVLGCSGLSVGSETTPVWISDGEGEGGISRPETGEAGAHLTLPPGVGAERVCPLKPSPSVYEAKVPWGLGGG